MLSIDRFGDLGVDARGPIADPPLLHDIGDQSDDRQVGVGTGRCAQASRLLRPSGSGAGARSRGAARSPPRTRVQYCPLSWGTVAAIHGGSLSPSSLKLYSVWWKRLGHWQADEADSLSPVLPSLPRKSPAKASSGAVRLLGHAEPVTAGDAGTRRREHGFTAITRGFS